MYRFIIVVFSVFFGLKTYSQYIIEIDSDSIFNTIKDDFYGIEYRDQVVSGNTIYPGAFSENNQLLDSLQPLNLKYVRMWARVTDFHPEPNVWNWENLDRQINEIINAGYKPIPCLFGEDWYKGTQSDPWWNYEDAIIEWENAAYAFTDRYKHLLGKILVFDEPNIRHPNNDWYYQLDNLGVLYNRTAIKIKSVNPNIKVGGPSGHNGRDSGDFALAVLNTPNGHENLDFIAINNFLTWDISDSDDFVMNRTIWFEEFPLEVRRMMQNQDFYPEIVLDAYNVGGAFGSEGVDPRNTNLFGGIVQGLALLHGAKGGYDITLRWDTAGKWGIFNWIPPFFSEAYAPYYSWKFLVEIAGLKKGSKIINCSTNEPYIDSAPHHWDQNVNLYRIQPFAIEKSDDNISVVLINKYNTEELRSINIPQEMNSYEIYRFDETYKTNHYYQILDTSNVVSNSIELNLPPMSITTINFSKCYYNLNISERIIANQVLNKTATNSIIASNIIEPEAEVNYSSGSYLKLTSGFHAQNGSYFKTSFDGCEGNMFTFSKALIEQTYNNEIDKVDTPNDFLLFPNPTKGNIKILSNNGDIDDARIIIYDINGLKLYDDYLKLEMNKNSIDLSNYNSGIYFLTLISNNRIYSQRIIKN